jgi:hypothetical protein
MRNTKATPVEPGFKRIYWSISMSLVGCRKEGWFDLPEDADDEDIEEMVKDAAFEEVEWNWSLEP